MHVCANNNYHTAYTESISATKIPGISVRESGTDVNNPG